MGVRILVMNLERLSVGESQPLIMGRGGLFGLWILGR